VCISSSISDSFRKMAVASVMYAVLPQIQNPFIYSLRNKDLKMALQISSVGLLNLYHVLFSFNLRFWSKSKNVDF
jgi:hypothetical protein